MEKVVLGIVDSPAQAEITVTRLQAMGFSPADVSVLFPDRRGSHDFGFERHSKSAEGALAGGAIGAVVGAAFGLAVGLGLVPVPALAALVSAGPIFVVACVFAVVGAAIGASVPEIHAKHYAGKVGHGSILVGVHVARRGELSRAREVFRSVAASNVIATGEAALPPGAPARA